MISANASECARYAAEELRDYVLRMTGVRLSIVDDSAPLPERAVLLGKTVYTERVLGGPVDLSGVGDDGFRLVARPPHLLVVASERRGVLYGVYELLERFGGCRWYSQKTECVPKTEAFAVPSDLDETQKPAFEMRAPFWYEVLSHPEFAARLKVNARPRRTPSPAKFGGEDYRFGQGLGICHTFFELLPVAKYGKEHPEYYALVNGIRFTDAGKDGKGEVWRVQPCLTNPDVLRIVTSNVLARIRRDPTARYYGISQNDNGNYCRCPQCAAVDEEEGSHAGTMVRFVNAVAEAVEKEFPDAIVETLAYTYTRKPPKKTRPRQNVIINLATIECDFARPIPESPYPQNKSFMDDIVGWGRISRRILVWDYTTGFVHYPNAFPNVRSLRGNLRFFRDNGVTAILEQGDSVGAHADFAELKTWLIAKWMWNPDLPEKELLDDFFAGYYGAAAPYVRRYFERLHDLQQAYSADPAHPLKIDVTYSSEAFGEAFTAEAMELWRQAAEAVKDDPVRAYNVRMGAFSVDYTRFLRHNPLYAFDDGSEARACQELARSLVARQKEGGIVFGEIPANHASYLALMEKAATMKPVLAKNGKIGLEESALMVLRRGFWGDFVADKQAGDGRALELYNTHWQWCVRLDLSQFSFRKGRKYKFLVKARAVLRPGVEGNVLSAGIYDEKTREACGNGLSLRTPDVKPGYAWYEIAEVEPTESSLLWMAPGVFDRGKGGQVAHDSVFIDRIAIVELGPKHETAGVE